MIHLTPSKVEKEAPEARFDQRNNMISRIDGLDIRV
jgi:hypothetical protein